MGDHITMVAQTPAEGVVAMPSFKDMRMFRIPCECHCDNEFDFSIEVDEHGIITTNISGKVKTPHWRSRLYISYDENWIVLNLKELYNDIFNRAEIIWNALTKGYVECYMDVLLTKQQSLNLSQVLIDSIKASEEFHEKRMAEFAAEKKAKEEKA